MVTVESIALKPCPHYKSNHLQLVRTWMRLGIFGGVNYTSCDVYNGSQEV